MVNITLEHAKAASFCFQYLTSPPFYDGLDVQSVRASSKQGYYAFQDYAVQHCLNHFEKSSAWELREHDAIYRITMKSIEDFVRSYSVSDQHQDTDREIQYEDIVRLLQDNTADKQHQDAHLSIGRRTIHIRREIENLHRQSLTPEELETIRNLYEPRTVFKCPRIKCVFFSTGFDKEADRARHVDRHDRPFCCPEDSCFAFKLGFDRKERLDEHLRDHHSPLDTGLRFPKPVVLTQQILCNASSRGDVVAISAILDCGLDVNGRSVRLRDFPLYLAAKKGHFEACKLLLERGAKVYLPETRETDVDTPKDTPFPPMDAAVQNRNHNIASLLLPATQLSNEGENRFDINLSSLGVWIDSSCVAGDLDMLRILLDTINPHHKLPAAITSACIWTPFNHAVENGHLAIIKYVLEIGFTHWVTPSTLFAAEAGRNEEIVRLLEPILEPIMNLPSNDPASFTEAEIVSPTPEQRQHLSFWSVRGRFIISKYRSLLPAIRRFSAMRLALLTYQRLRCRILPRVCWSVIKYTFSKSPAYLNRCLTRVLSSRGSR